MLNPNSLSQLSRKRKDSRTDTKKTKSANKDELCKGCRSDLENFNKLTADAKKINEIKKRAIIRSICTLGSRLCFIRDSGILDTLSVKPDTKQNILDVIYYRNQFVHKEIYMSPNEKDDLFKKLLNLESIDGKKINLKKIMSLVIILENKKDITELINVMNVYKKESKEDEENQEMSASEPYKNNKIEDTINYLEAAKIEALFLESVQKSDISVRETELAIDHCIGNMLQAYLDYKRSLGNPSNGSTRTLKKQIESEDSKTKISKDALYELQTATDTRKEFAHLDETENLKIDNKPVFLGNIFSNYFDELLKNAKKIQADIASKTQTSKLQNATDALTKTNIAVDEENLNNTNASMVGQFEQFKNPEKSGPNDDLTVKEAQKMTESQTKKDTKEDFENDNSPKNG